MKEKIEKELENLKGQITTVHNAYKEVIENLKLLNIRKVNLKANLDKLGGAVEMCEHQMRTFFGEEKPEEPVVENLQASNG
ncbi:MAG TPA: hypothetical protein VHA52_09990 [Candidatus Babeliaceae bacterium]|nr:hypothetical protein [Candidatus Babeliaceae bacterium]